MKKLSVVLISAAAIIFFGSQKTAVAQSLAHYSIARDTGISYTSIASTGNSISSWRHNDPTQMLDDNRSNPIPIGFDFWYDGVRYTTLSVGINGLVDFSSSAATGFTSGDYDSDNFTGTSPQIRMTSLTGFTSRNALAVMYGDLTTQNVVDPLGNSFKYLTTGIAPNRVLTVEWINLSYYSQYMGESYNFQLKLYENTGVIEYLYGNNTAGTGTPLKYKTGFNAPSFSALSDSVVLIQQNANSTNFLPQPVTAWGTGYWGGYTDTLPTINSKLMFTPLVPQNPTNLTFSLVDQTSMILSWNDNANNEVGYAIYNSLDGVNYMFSAQVSKDTITYKAIGLSPETMYYWKVYAVTEGGLSASLDNSQATTGAENFTSAQTGTWNTSTTWDAGIPTPNSNVTIAAGHTITLDGNIIVNNITIASGGTLLIGDNNTPRTINVLGNITVNAGAQFIINTTSNTSNHQLNISGNIINNNIFDLATDADSRCRITFNRFGNQSMSGTGPTTRFYLMTLNMGSTNTNVLDISSSNFTTQSAGFLTITNGTFKYETPNAITPFIANTTIPLTGGLWVNNSSAIVTTTGGNLSYSGFIRVTGGVLNVGTAADQQLLSNGGNIIVEGGSVNVAGSFNRTNNVTITKFAMTGGTMKVATIGSSNAILSPFLMDILGSSFTMSGGRIVVVREGGTGSNDLGYVNTGTTSYSITGGTLQIGDYTTPVGQVMQVNTNIPVFNFVDSSANATAQLTTNNLNVNNNLLIAAGAVDANNLNITVQKDWINQGRFIPGTGTVTFSGAAGSVLTRAAGDTLNNLTINKSSNDVSLGGALTINGTLNFASAHNLILGNYNLASNGAVTGAADGKCVVTNGIGTVSKVVSTIGSFTFPVGSAADYRPLVLHVNTLVGSGKIVVKHTEANPGNTSLPSMVNHISTKRYWTITPDAGITSIASDITLRWGSNDDVSDSANVTVVHGTAGGAWDIANRDGAATGDAASGTVTGNGFTTLLGDFTLGNQIGGSNLLPVEMTSFTAVMQGISALLNWSTATEVNNSGFEIERRAVNGEQSTVNSWIKVGFVSGAGTSNSPKSYSFQDAKLAPGVYVYRIKQIDNDGAFKYSASTQVDAGVANVLQLCGNYPNPFNPTTTIQFSIPQDGNASLKIYNILGQEVATLFSGMAKTGHYIQTTFDASRLASGIYFARLQFGGKNLVQRMMLTK